MVREKNYETNRTLSTKQFRLQTTNQQGEPQWTSLDGSH